MTIFEKHVLIVKVQEGGEGEGDEFLFPSYCCVGIALSLFLVSKGDGDELSLMMRFKIRRRNSSTNYLIRYIRSAERELFFLVGQTADTK